MTTPPTHWIAGTGRITPVVLVEAGTGGQELSFVPPDPVVVRSIEDYFEFVASESALFTDRGLAIAESRRLRDEELSRAKVLLAQIERREAMAGSLYPIDPKILEDKSSDPPQPVVKVSIETVKPPVEVVAVQKKSTPEETTKPVTLLDRITYVIGRETISFDDICQRLHKRHWAPKRRSSVSNVLSAHKNLFNCPTRSMYTLRNKPKVSPVESDDESKEVTTTAAPPVETNESDDSGNDETVQASDDEETDEEADESDDESEVQVQAHTTVELPSDEEIPTEFASWLGKPMTSLSQNRAHYHDDGVLLAEKSNGDGKWTAEIHVTGMELWYEGHSEDRHQARELAEFKLRSKLSSINSIIEDLGV